MSSGRSRSYAWTLNNPTAAEEAAIRRGASDPSCIFLCFAPEVAPRTGTPHLQGYVYFKDARTLTSVKQFISPRCHLEAAKGTPEENKTYCCGPWTGDVSMFNKKKIFYHSKFLLVHTGTDRWDKTPKVKPANPEYWESGVLPQQGKRKDIDKVRELVKAGAPMTEIIEEASSLQSIRTAEVLYKYLEGQRSWVTEVHWFWGPTGTGKSHQAFTQAGPEAYVPLSAQWFEGYDRHENVVLDDIRHDWFLPIGGFSGALRLFDKWPLKVATKGGSRQFLAKKVFVTAPVPPEAFWDNVTDEAQAQFQRRITSVTHVPTRYVPPQPSTSV